MNINTVGQASFEDVLEGAGAEVCETAHSIRQLLAEVMPGITEVPWIGQKTIGYGVGPKKMSEHFCYIGLHKAHVNLGFLYGADLKDPKGLLQGSGKLLRHIKLASPAAVRQPGVRQLVAQASEHLPKLGSDE